MADVNFPVTHPQYLGDLDPTSPRAGALFRDVDVLIGIGCSMFAEGFLVPEATVSPNTKIIHVDDNPWELGKNLPTDCAMQGDIKATLGELNSSLRASLSATSREQVAARIGLIAKEKTTSDTEFRARLTAGQDGLPISIPRLMTELAQSVGPDTVVWMNAGLRPARSEEPLTSRNPKAFSAPARAAASVGDSPARLESSSECPTRTWSRSWGTAVPPGRCRVCGRLHGIGSP